MVLDKGTCLRFYKRKEIQEAMVFHAQNKEFGVRYGEIFGKRPDVLTYPRDVLELAMQNVTSFHASEELWSNPLSLGGENSKIDMDNLRVGWDLVLDIDCKDWEFSKLTTYLFIKALRDSYVKDVTCKFSGNKGFHIGVPFESFPKEIAGKPTKDIFPLGPQKIARYLLNKISENYVTVQEDKIIFDGKFSFSLNQLREKFGDKKFILRRCQKCDKKIDLTEEEQAEFICPRCEANARSDKTFLICEKCHKHMTKLENNASLCECGSNEAYAKFDPLTLIEVDTILISSRHLYRMPYSLHEKSGLASLPLDPDKILEFEKSQAHPDKVSPSSFIFLNRQVQGESARTMLMQSLDFEIQSDTPERKPKIQREEVKIESPIHEEFFPPCIKTILNGLTDGRKRGVFCLINYLGKIGWGKEDIREYVLKWNQEKNPVPLREVYIKGQMAHFVPGQKLPPNCDNESYYLSFGAKCKNESLCQKIKNPVNYTIIRWRKHRELEEEAPKRNKKKTAKDQPQSPN